MKKDKNSLKQKIVIAIACLVIVACTISMTTMAWFTDTMQGTTNLTFGKIKLSDDYTKYTFNTPEAPAVASRQINNGNWTIVLDETSNDAFIRLIAKYGAPVKYTLTKDSTYLPNKAYYNHTTKAKLNPVESGAVPGTSYVVGADIPANSVDECNYSLEYIKNNVQVGENLTLAKIVSERYTTQYYKLGNQDGEVSVLGTAFLKGVKYYAFVGGEFRALIGSTTYDANTDYYYGMLYADFDPDGNTTADDIYVGYKYVSGSNATYKIVPNDIALTEDETYQDGKSYYNSLGIELSVTVDAEITAPNTTVYEATSTYFKLVEATSTEGTIDIAANSQIEAGNDGYRYVIYNAYIDWLIENVLLPESPEAAVDLGEYTSITTVGATNTVTTDNKYGFIRTDGTAQGTAEYYLVSDVTGTMLAAKRTNEANVTDSNDDEKTVEAGKSYNYVFAEDGDIKIKDSADQITLKSATLAVIADSTALAAAVGENGDRTKVLVKDANGFYKLYNNETYDTPNTTFYTYTGDVTVYNNHVYFLEVASNATPLVLKYAQKDLGLGMSVDIQAIQTILSRKATDDDADLFGTASVSEGDKLTIAIIVAADTVATGSSLNPANEAGKLGAYLNGKVVRVATIADIAPFFDNQFGLADGPA